MEIESKGKFLVFQENLPFFSSESVPLNESFGYLAGLFGAVRFCYNKALYLKTHFYKVKGVNLHPIHDLKKLIAKQSDSIEFRF